MLGDLLRRIFLIACSRILRNRRTGRSRKMWNAPVTPAFFNACSANREQMLWYRRMRPSHSNVQVKSDQLPFRRRIRNAEFTCAVVNRGFGSRCVLGRLANAELSKHPIGPISFESTISFINDLRSLCWPRIRIPRASNAWRELAITSLVVMVVSLYPATPRRS